MQAEIDKKKQHTARRAGRHGKYAKQQENISEMYLKYKFYLALN